MQGVLLNLGLLLNLITASGGHNSIITAPVVADNTANPVAIVVKPEGSDIMSGPEDEGTWRRLHLPANFLVEEWGKKDNKLFVWSRDLEWGGWAPASDFKIVTQEEAKDLYHYKQPFSSGQGEKVDVPVTVSVVALETVLREANSPVINDEPDFASYIYKRSFFYGVDPAYLLAFFKKESAYGTAGAPTYTKNIGNIRCSAGYECANGWRKYATWKASADDWFNLIATNYVGYGLDTVSRIVRVYAPASDGNNTGQYIWQINSMVNSYRERSK